MNELELRTELDKLLLDEEHRRRMWSEYNALVITPLGEAGASEHAAEKMIALLGKG